MVKETQLERPYYHKIFKDMINDHCPNKLLQVQDLIKPNMSELDVIKLNTILFKKNTKSSKYKSYNQTTVLEILNFQKSNNMSNIQLAKHFGISRNTIAKWKKNYHYI